MGHYWFSTNILSNMDFQLVSAVSMENVDFGDVRPRGVIKCVKFSQESNLQGQSGSSVIALLFL